MQLWRGVDADAAAKLTAQEAGGLLQPELDFGDLALAGQRAEIDAGVGIVRRHLDFGDADHADARVLHLGRMSSASSRRICSLTRSLREKPALCLEGAGNFLDLVTSSWSPSSMSLKFFSDRPHLEVGLDFLDVVLEALERIELAVPLHDVAAQQAGSRVAPDHAIEHITTGDGADLRSAEDLADLDRCR